MVEGGNWLPTGGVESSPFNVESKVSEATKLQKSLYELLLEVLNSKFLEIAGEPLWARYSKLLWSGSSRILFSYQNVGQDVRDIKYSFGDVDIKVDETKKEQIINFFEKICGEGSNGKNLKEPIVFKGKLGEYKLTGWKSGDTIITQWRIFIKKEDSTFEEYLGQIDLECVPFNSKTNLPKRSVVLLLSSPIDDLKLGIKGAFHKMLLEALVFSNKEKQNLNVVTNFNTTNLSAFLNGNNKFTTKLEEAPTYGLNLSGFYIYKYAEKFSEVVKELLGSTVVVPLELSNAYVKYNDLKDLLKNKKYSNKQSYLDNFVYNGNEITEKETLNVLKKEVLVGYNLNSFAGLVKSLSQKGTVIKNEVFVHFLIKISKRKLAINNTPQSVRTKMVAVNYMNEIAGLGYTPEQLSALSELLKETELSKSSSVEKFLSELNSIGIKGIKLVKQELKSQEDVLI